MYRPRIKEKYLKEVVPEMKKKMGYKNDFAVPRIVKVVVNSGLGGFMKNSGDDLEKIEEDFANIVGQKGVVTKAKKAIAGFKTKQGMPLGVMATLRGARMYEFLDKLINVVLPQVRDFRGLNKKAFDGKGNYNIGIKEHIVFPEVKRDDIRNIIGIQVTIVTTAKTNEEAMEMLKELGLPITDDVQ